MDPGQSPDTAGTNNDSWWAVTAVSTTAWAVGSYVDETSFHSRHSALGSPDAPSQSSQHPTDSSHHPSRTRHVNRNNNM